MCFSWPSKTCRGQHIPDLHVSFYVTFKIGEDDTADTFYRLARYVRYISSHLESQDLREGVMYISAPN